MVANANFTKFPCYGFCEPKSFEKSEEGWTSEVSHGSDSGVISFSSGTGVCESFSLSNRLSAE